MKRKNAVAAMIVLFICVAVYLNWSYTRGIGLDDAANVNSGKILGEAALADNEQKEDKKEDKKNEEAKKGEDKGSADVSDDYFTNARLDKQKARDSALNILKESVNKENSSQGAKDKASASIETLAAGAVNESRIETLIKAKGYKDCVALINSDGVNVIVKAPDGGLTASDITKIKDIVVSEAKVKPSQIKIVEIK
ncbi:MAG: SpoIIIAH-like family protein [Clostridia bacterium]